ncbi:MAG: type II secretion system protein [Verrucomicrobia bacterium]|nr:type II secretion system protein [Verrucomicrobiota bacterium]
MKKTVCRSGMTLVEVLMTVTIIAVLSAVLMPAISMATRHRENLQAADRLRTAVSAFELYAEERGVYPTDKTPGVIPPEMSTYYFPYFKIDWWGETTPIGGNWDWDAGYRFAYSISIHAPARGVKQLTDFDALIDDGNLATGKFRGVGNHYHYILEE